MVVRKLVVAAAAAVALVAVCDAPSASAGDVSGPRFEGMWKSASLRTDQVGYTMKVSATSVPGRYAATLRMTFQDGSRGPGLSASLAVDGARATLHVTGQPAVHGTFGQDGSLFFPRCYRALPDAERSQADTMCLFAQLPG